MNKTSVFSGEKPSHRRELNGPRPTPLKLNKGSQKIHKTQSQAKPPPPQQQQHPIIIYAISPEIIHADPREFMSLVQRLTGAAAESPAIPIKSTATSPTAAAATGAAAAPLVEGNASQMDLFEGLLGSPSSFLTTPVIPSPGALLELLNHLKD